MCLAKREQNSAWNPDICLTTLTLGRRVRDDHLSSRLIGAFSPDKQEHFVALSLLHNDNASN